MTTQSQPKDQRRNTRSGLTIGDHQNHFFLRCGEQVHEIEYVRDVSISGVGLELQQPLPAGNQVALKYESDDFQLTINGTVKWCDRSDRGDGCCSIGIEFDPQDYENNSLFFLALRKFLDDFDSAYIDA